MRRSKNGTIFGGAKSDTDPGAKRVNALRDKIRAMKPGWLVCVIKRKLPDGWELEVMVRAGKQGIAKATIAKLDTEGISVKVIECKPG